MRFWMVLGLQGGGIASLFVTALLGGCGGPASAPADPVDPMPRPAVEPVEAPASEPAPAPEPDPPAVPEPAALSNPPPHGFVDLATLQHVRVEPRYHTADNFSGAPLPGYGAPAAWLEKRAADALQYVADEVAKEGHELLVYDAYRPVRATKAMVAWTERTGQANLITDGYIASRSGHNTGYTVDLTLMRDGEPLDMGTPWDTFSTDSHTDNASGQALENRKKLSAAMRKGGWRPYSKEWWHFSWGKAGPARDVPYGCFEPPEGEWKPPEGWSKQGYVAPASWTATACSAE